MPSSCDKEKSLPPEFSALVWTEQRPRGRKWLRVTEAEGIHHMWEESKHRLVVPAIGLGFLLGLWRASQMFSSEGSVGSFWRNDSGIQHTSRSAVEWGSEGLAWGEGHFSYQKTSPGPLRTYVESKEG